MTHDTSLIATLSAAFALALLFGLIAMRLRLPALVGYLLAGVVIGPATPGFVADIELANELAEVGVMLLMFGVGLHFSVGDVLSVRRVALPGALLQIALLTLAGALLATGLGLPAPGAVVFGLCLSVSSTVVLLRQLEARGQINSLQGRTATGWLVVEDLAMVLVLVLLPPAAEVLMHGAQADEAGLSGLAITLTLTIAKVASLIILMLGGGRRVLPRLLWMVARTGSRELFTLCVIALAVGVAWASARLFEVSFALGAFLAGAVMRESEFSRRAADDSLPFRDAFAVLFFVAAGMLFKPQILWHEPLAVAITVGLIVLGRLLFAAAFLRLARYPLATALVVGASLAQIGEFSFILAQLGHDLGLLDDSAQQLILAGAILSIALNPAAIRVVQLVCQWLQRRFPALRPPLGPEDPLSELPPAMDSRLVSGQVVLVGYGRVGRATHDRLLAGGVTVVVAERERTLVEGLRHADRPAVIGDATTPEVLIQAHIARAALLVITLRDALAVRRILDIARQINPGIAVVVSAGSRAEARLLREGQVDDVFVAEVELGRSLATRAIERLLEQAGSAS
jgi:monovalent cation:H+ antiporter-2, CPA2 family